MIRRMNIGVVVILIGFLLLPLAGDAQVKTVKVAATSKDVLDNLPLFVGVRMGFFEEAGLKLEISYFRGGGEVVRAITTKSVDIGATPSAAAILIAASKGESLKIISSSAAPIVGVVWIVSADSPLKTIKDLKGKKAGFSSPGSLTHTVLQTVLRKEGLDKDVQLVRVGSPGDSWAAVKNKVVDVGWHVSPGVYNLIAKKEARILFDASDYIKDYQQTVVAVMEDVAKRDPEMIRNFLKARAKAVKFIGENTERTATIWAEELQLPVEVVRLAFKDIKPTYWETGAPKESNMKGALQEVMETGAIKEPIDFKKLIDTSFLPK